MRERPIIFSTPMVQAILAGTKTQTRRVIKPQPIIHPVPPCNPDFNVEWKGRHTYLWANGRDVPRGALQSCPYGQCGDRLWVRETWTPCATIDSWLDNSKLYAYKADYAGKVVPWKWKPSIHMPREAARIFLRVTNVRVERLQDILCGDMKREGCIPDTVVGGQYQQWQRDYWIPLWDSVNKKRGYGWDSNPWVWVIEFKRVEGTADVTTDRT